MLRDLSRLVARARAWRRRREVDERGAIAIIMAVALVAIVVSAGMVLDLGLLRVDRQVDQSAGDAASLAGAHALDAAGSGTAYPYVGVCAAARYLQVNDPRFTGLDPDTGWTDGQGHPEPSGCSTPALQHASCVPGNTASWAVFSWQGSWQGAPISVTIRSGYSLAGSGWAEDQLPASSGDADDGARGCYQIATTITQQRQPGAGGIAHPSDLATSVRSVARESLAPGGYAPALLLLQQSGCGALSTGTSAGGSQIRVIGAISANGLTQPGTIHSDSDGSGCGSHDSILEGNANDGIVASAAPLASDPTAPDPTKPGLITTYASMLGLSGTAVRDSAAYVCGVATLYPTASCPSGADVSGSDLVTRQPIDQRYLAGVRGMLNAANAVFANPSSGATYTETSCTRADWSTLASLPSTATAYIDCTKNNGFTDAGTIGAGTVIFAGSVNPSGVLSLPNATRVYIVGTGSAKGDALSLGNGGTFSMHTASATGSNLDPSTGQCSDAATGTSDKAVLVVQGGDLEQTDGTLQLCNTTVLMEGGAADACLPAAPSRAAPNPSTPCAGGTGSGQIAQTGGNVDWTAPNQYDAIFDPDGTADPVKAASWADPAGPEDLALWDESGGTNSNPSYQLTGGGSMHIAGVLMVPNAEPLTLKGQFAQSLVGAQFITGAIALSSNNTSLTLRVDPDSAMTLPQLETVGLVR